LELDARFVELGLGPLLGLGLGRRGRAPAAQPGPRGVGAPRLVLLAQRTFDLRGAVVLDGLAEILRPALRPEARLEHGAERPDLALGRRTGALGADRVRIPRAREAGQVGAPAVAVRGEHR